MDVEAYIQHLKNSPSFMQNVAAWRVLPAREARYVEFPEGLDPRLSAALGRRGIARPYLHQRQAMDAALAGEDFVVVTPTASGKTLCYNVPCWRRSCATRPAARCTCFPPRRSPATRWPELYALIEDMDVPVKAYTYDGDTPPRRARPFARRGTW